MNFLHMVVEKEIFWPPVGEDDSDALDWFMASLAWSL